MFTSRVPFTIGYVAPGQHEGRKDRGEGIKDKEGPNKQQVAACLCPFCHVSKLHLFPCCYFFFLSSSFVFFSPLLFG